MRTRPLRSHVGVSGLKKRNKNTNLYVQCGSFWLLYSPEAGGTDIASLPETFETTAPAYVLLALLKGKKLSFSLSRLGCRTSTHSYQPVCRVSIRVEPSRGADTTDWRNSGKDIH